MPQEKFTATLLALSLSFVSLTLLARVEARTLEPEDDARMREVADPSLSPDGKHVLYTVMSTDLDKDRTYYNLWIASWDGKENRPLTHGEHSQTHARWSPDGKSIAFLSGRGAKDDDERDALWMLPVAGGEAEKVSELPGDVEDFAWSPDSSKLVLVVRDADPRSPEPGAKKHTAPPLVIDRLRFMRDTVGYLTERFAHLVLLDAVSHEVTPLTSGRHDDLYPTWSPDGKEIAFFSARGPDLDRVDDWSLLAILARAGGSERLITQAPQTAEFVESDPPLAWSPDGKTLAFTHGGEAKYIEYAAHGLAVVPAAGGAYRDLTAQLDRNILRPHWSPDGRSILAVLEDDGTQILVRFPAGGGTYTPVLGGERKIDGFDVSHNGAIVVLSATTQRPPEVFALDGNQTRPLSRQNDEWLAGIELGKVERTSFKSKDGTQIHGWLVHPVGQPAGTRSAAYLRPHGGPQEQFAAEFEMRAQVFAAQGYLVILPNYRGSTGRGTAFSSAIFADWGHLEVEDDLAAVDAAVDRGLADPERLVVGGWSYGGISTDYLIATTTRFKAAVSGASISNVLAGYGTDQYVTDYEHELGAPWQTTNHWLELSYPFLHANRIHTPTLFMCGDKDMNVPLTNSEQMYQALRSLGVPTELVIYPDQWHGLTTPSYIIDRYRRQLAWYARYVKAR
jgi:dipeptidyl aminopeptidase/acylaminoacyl peptidase